MKRRTLEARITGVPIVADVSVRKVMAVFCITQNIAYVFQINVKNYSMSDILHIFAGVRDRHERQHTGEVITSSTFSFCHKKNLYCKSSAKTSWHVFLQKLKSDKQVQNICTSE